MGGMYHNPYLSFLLLVAFVILIVIIGYILIKLLRRTSRLQRLFRCSKKGKKCQKKGSSDDSSCCEKGLCDWAQFYAEENVPDGTNDNPNPIAPGQAIAFPNTGVSKGSGNIVIDTAVTPVGTAIRLVNIGTYQVSVSAQVGEAGQLVVALDSGSGAVEQAPDYVGTRAAGLQAFTVLVTTTLANVNLYIVNPANQTTPVTLPAGVGSSGNATQNAILTILKIDG
jgi:hypothetical protein